MKFLYGALAQFAVEKPMVTKKKKRILMLYDFPIKGGGSGTYVKQLALQLQKKEGYDVAIAAPDKNIIDPSLKQFIINLPQIPVFISRPGLEKSKKYSELSVPEMAELYHAYLRETLRIVEEFKPTIIHVHHLLVNAWVADFIRGVYGIKYVVTSHGSCIYVVKQDRRYFRKTREALRAADVITVVSSDVRGKLLRMFDPSLSRKTRTIAGAVQYDQFPKTIPLATKYELIKKYNIDEGKVVLFTGRLINEKGVEYLVKAASRINGQVVIAGDGSQKKYLEELIKKTNLKNVKLVGYIDHATLVNFYYLAEVFVSPAVWDDPMPLTVIEAMAAKLPVVVTRRGGIAKAVKDGGSGFFVKARNATDIAEKVNMLLADKKLRMKMGEQARAVVLRKFTWKEIAKKFATIYSNM